MSIQGYKGMAAGVAWRNLTPLAASLLLVLAGSAQATESTVTPHLVGNKPKASNVKITPPSPNRGDTVRVAWDYNDVDGDKEENTTVEWLIGNDVVGKGTSYSIPIEYAKQRLEAKVTPRSASPATPNMGDVATHSVSINDIFWGNIVEPPTNELVASKDSVSFCVRKRGRLPTQNELFNIFKNNTNASKWGEKSSDEMCTIHGWPIFKKCGGSLVSNASDQASYWTSEVDWGANDGKGHRYSVHMSGIKEVYDYGHPEAKALVVCIK